MNEIMFILMMTKVVSNLQVCLVAYLLFSDFLVQVFEVLDKEVPEETQCPGLAASDCIQQG